MVDVGHVLGGKMGCLAVCLCEIYPDLFFYSWGWEGPTPQGNQFSLTFRVYELS
jgi:hypothetical protein